MSTLDNALQALFQMAHWEKLWENARPTSTFAAQNVPVSTSEYEMLIVVFRRTNNSENYSAGTIILGKLGSGSQAYILGYSGTMVARAVNWTNTSTINFEACNQYNTYAGNPTAMNNMLIPTEIYGIKL